MCIFLNSHTVWKVYYIKQNQKCEILITSISQPKETREKNLKAQTC